MSTMEQIPGLNFHGYHDAPPSARESLRSQVADARASRFRLRGLRDAAHADVATQAARQKTSLRKNLSGQIAAASGAPQPTFAGALETALRRTKMRSRVESQGDKAIEQQQLSDRVKIAKAGRAREGAYMTAAAQAANIREGVNVGVSNANQFIQNSRMNMWGGIAGGLAGAISNPEFRSLFKNSSGPTIDADAMRAQYLPGDA